MLDLFEGLSELHLPPQELNFSIAVRLNPRDSFVLPSFPYFIQIFEELVHQTNGNLASAFVSEVMSHLKGFLWDPIFDFFSFFEALKFGLVLWEVAGGWLPLWIKVPHRLPTIVGKFCEILEFFRRCQQLNQSLVIHFVMLSLEQSSPLALSAENNLV